MLQQKIQSEMIKALKTHDQTSLDVLRFILSQIKYAEIEKKKELNDEEVISVLQKEVKKRKEAIELFKKLGKSEVVPVEEQQVAVIQEFLPKQLSQQEVEKVVEEALKSTGPNPHIGQVIGIVMGKLKGKADGSIVASLVRKKLTQ